jgi:hypothetical protein
LKCKGINPDEEDKKNDPTETLLPPDESPKTLSPIPEGLGGPPKMSLTDDHPCSRGMN